MGYRIFSEGSLLLPKENVDAAWQRMRRLNSCDNLKVYQGHCERSVAPESPSLGNPAYCFWWLPWDYDVRFQSAAELFEALGFCAEETEEGLLIDGFGTKTGSEAIFFQAIADLFPDGSRLHWTGDYDLSWDWFFHDGRLILETDRERQIRALTGLM